MTEDKTPKDTVSESKEKTTTPNTTTSQATTPVNTTPTYNTNQRGQRPGDRRGPRRDVVDLENWKPKTIIGKAVHKEEITDLSEILDNGQLILESEIVDKLLPNLKSDLLSIGQSKGKFGGGKKSIWRQVQKKTAEGNKASFATLAAVGNEDGYVGIGYGKARETVPARSKATKKAKTGIIKIRRGCGSWECGCATPHSIPFKVTGYCGSIGVTLMPAPKGKGLIIEKECSKILKLAGIKDVYTKTEGHTKTKLNLLKACFDALRKLSEMKVHGEHYKKIGIHEGIAK